MKMPFERLMELVSALSDEDAALPMGVLSERWGEQVGRIGDAIDAVRVMRGERTYITVRPAPEPCRGFRWLGQSFASCDQCGRPAWEHEGEMRPGDGSSPFSDDGWELHPWEPGEAEAIRRKWGTPPVTSATGTR